VARHSAPEDPGRVRIAFSEQLDPTAPAPPRSGRHFRPADEMVRPASFVPPPAIPPRPVVEPRVVAPAPVFEPRVVAPAPVFEPRVVAPAPVFEPRVVAPAPVFEPRFAEPGWETGPEQTGPIELAEPIWSEAVVHSPPVHPVAEERPAPALIAEDAPTARFDWFVGGFRDEDFRSADDSAADDEDENGDDEDEDDGFEDALALFDSPDDESGSPGLDAPDDLDADNPDSADPALGDAVTRGETSEPSRYGNTAHGITAVATRPVHKPRVAVTGSQSSRSSAKAARRRSRRRRGIGALTWWITVVVVAILVAVLMRSFVIQSFWIPSGSMEPTLHGCSGCQNDRVLVDKLSYRLHDVNRGDVVVFSRPAGVPEEDKYLIKRVVGLAGETISARAGTVIVDGRSLVENYVNPQCAGTEDFGPTTIPAGKIFVMGDNRCGSLDSRGFGTINESTVVGRAFLIIWPVGRLHWL
jgi:signal peptidase I